MKNPSDQQHCHANAHQSSLTSHDVANIRKKYFIPDSVSLRVPLPSERACSKVQGKGEIAIYEICFEAGLRLPFPRVVREVLQHLGLAPAQLVPNAWRHLIGCATLRAKNGQTPLTKDVFLYIYQVSETSSGSGWWYFTRRGDVGGELVGNVPSSNKGWENRFLFMGGTGMWEEEEGSTITWGSPSKQSRERPILSKSRPKELKKAHQPEGNTEEERSKMAPKLSTEALKNLKISRAASSSGSVLAKRKSCSDVIPPGSPPNQTDLGQEEKLPPASKTRKNAEAVPLRLASQTLEGEEEEEPEARVIGSSERVQSPLMEGLSALFGASAATPSCFRAGRSVPPRANKNDVEEIDGELTSKKKKDGEFVVVRCDDGSVILKEGDRSITVLPQHFDGVEGECLKRLLCILRSKPSTFINLGEMPSIERRFVLREFGQYLDELGKVKLSTVSRGDLSYLHSRLEALLDRGLKVGWLLDRNKRMSAQIDVARLSGRIEEVRLKLRDERAKMEEVRLKLQDERTKMEEVRLKLRAKIEEARLKLLDVRATGAQLEEEEAILLWQLKESGQVSISEFDMNGYGGQGLI